MQKKWSLLVANGREFAEFLRELGKIHGFALIALGAMLFGLQAMLYMTPKQVVTGPPESPTTKVGHETYPAPGILGLVCLTAGVAILVTRRRADQLEAKNALSSNCLSGERWAESAPASSKTKPSVRIL